MNHCFPMDWSGTIVASYSFNLLLVYCFRDGYRITQRCLYAEPFYVVRTRRLDTDTNAEISARCGNPRDRLWVSGFSLSLSLSLGYHKKTNFTERSFPQIGLSLLCGTRARVTPSSFNFYFSSLLSRRRTMPGSTRTNGSGCAGNVRHKRATFKEEARCATPAAS